MDKLDIAITLLYEARDEKKRLDEMTAKIDKLKNDSDYWRNRYTIEESYKPIPRKSVVNDSIKMARRFLLESYL